MSRRHLTKQLERVFLTLSNQISTQGGVNPILFRHILIRKSNIKNPQVRTGFVRFLSRYTAKSFKSEQAPHLPWCVTMYPESLAVSSFGKWRSLYSVLAESAYFKA